jgi:cytochrome bd-type quinol oxidase subunit 1
MAMETMLLKLEHWTYHHRLIISGLMMVSAIAYYVLIQFVNDDVAHALTIAYGVGILATVTMLQLGDHHEKKVDGHGNE